MILPISLPCVLKFSACCQRTQHIILFTSFPHLCASVSLVNVAMSYKGSIQQHVSLLKARLAKYFPSKCACAFKVGRQAA